MWKEIKAFLQAVFKTCLIVGLFFGSFEYLNKVFYNREVYHGHLFRSLPENSIDVLVLGSSHAQYSFIPSFFYQETGLYSYILGSACQPMEVTYEMLKEALKTQSPSILILEAYTTIPLHENCLGNSCYVLAEYQMTGQEKYNTINYLPEDVRKDYLNDFLNYHNDWKTMTDYELLLPKNVLAKPSSENNDFGYVYQSAKLPAPNWWYPFRYDDNEPEPVELKPQDLDSLNKIYALCQENDISMYLYKTAIDNYTEENYQYLHATWRWAEERGIPYTDFCDEARAIDYAMWIQGESGHAYVNGAGLVTHILAQRVSELPSRHVANPELDVRYTSSGNGYTVDYLRYEFNPNRVLDRLSFTSGILAIRYNAELNPDENVIAKLSTIIGKDFDSSQDQYIYMNKGKIVKESNEPFSFEVDGNTYEFTETDVLYNDESTGNLGSLSLCYSYNDVFPVVHNIRLNGYVWEIGYDYYTKLED